jgi:HD-GYP domain-containing protein (c-di-GMP phosphodiesterase class II)
LSSIRGIATRRLRLAAALTLAGAFAAGALLQLAGGLGDLERATLQARFQIRHRPRPHGIVVVGIDPRTFQDLGLRWPFPRLLHARLIDRLHAARVREIVYDVQFTQRTDTLDDNALIAAIGRAGGAALASTIVSSYGHTPVLGGNATLQMIRAQAGYSAFFPTSAGVVERVRYSVGGVPSLAVLAAQRVTGRPPSHAGFGHEGALIDFQGAAATFPVVSFSDVLAGRVPASALRGQVAVVGATDPVLQDVHATPTGSRLMAGPQLQANAIWTVLHGVPLRDAPDALALLVIAIGAAVAPLARLRARPLGAALIAITAGAGYAVVAQLTFDAGTVLPVVPPLAALLASTVGMVGLSELLEAAERRRLGRQLYESQLELIHRLGQAAESRDRHTGEHLGRIARLTNLLGLAAGMTPHEAELLRHASLMHDIGKVGVPDSVLLKAGPLDPEERELMNSHTHIGGEILSGSSLPLVQMAEEVARSHHERWDGSGYPAGLKGEEIPLAARICSVCDVFDALVTARTYKPAWSVEEAVEELRRLSGTAFDPELVEKFVALVPALDSDLLQPSGPLAPADAAPVLTQPAV